MKALASQHVRDSTSSRGWIVCLELLDCYPSPTTRRTSQRGPNGSPIVTTEHLDDFGGVLRREDRQHNVLMERVVDAFGRSTRETGPGGDQMLIGYDAWSNVASIKKTVAGRPKDVLLERVHNYDNRGRLASIELGGVPSVSFAHDRLGRVVRAHRAGRDTLTQYVGASNQVLSKTMPSGRKLHYEYNDPRRLMTAIVADATAVPDVFGPAELRVEPKLEPWVETA